MSGPGFDGSSKYGLLAETRGGTEGKEPTGKDYKESSDMETPMIRPKIKKDGQILKNK